MRSETEFEAPAEGGDAVAATAPLDPVGRATLELFAHSGSYNRFLWRRLRSLGPPRGRVLEVGCGIGNITHFLLAEPEVEAVHALDPDPAYVETVRRELGCSRLTLSACSLEAFRPPAFPEGSDGLYDAIVSSNVLEHIEDDRQAMRDFARLLRPGGVVLLLVPAHRWLYSDLDRNLSHYRRYRRRDLQELADVAGLRLEQARHFNPVGVLGWWLNGKVLRRAVLPAGQLRLYSRFAVPLSVLADRLNPFPLGISLLARFVKP